MFTKSRAGFFYGIFIIILSAIACGHDPASDSIQSLTDNSGKNFTVVAPNADHDSPTFPINFDLADLSLNMVTRVNHQYNFVLNGNVAAQGWPAGSYPELCEPLSELTIRLTMNDGRSQRFSLDAEKCATPTRFHYEWMDSQALHYLRIDLIDGNGIVLDSEVLIIEGLNWPTVITPHPHLYE